MKINPLEMLLRSKIFWHRGLSYLIIPISLFMYSIAFATFIKVYGITNWPIVIAFGIFLFFIILLVGYIDDKRNWIKYENAMLNKNNNELMTIYKNILDDNKK